jgi:glycosidase
LYKQLSKEAAKRGLGIVKDLVLNHIGSGHWWMDDLPTKDWLNHQDKYIQTNHIHETVFDPYVTRAQRDLFTDGWFVETMPDLNQRNEFVANYLIQATMWWVEYISLSSIRVDTYPYVDKNFLSLWSKKISEEFPYLNFFGEAWVNDVTLVSYWQKGAITHDGYESYIPAMKDFPLQKSLVTGLNSDDAWDSGIGNIYRSLSKDFQYGNPYNLVTFADNHDMQRIFSLMGENMDLYKMALTIILTTRGIPCILYGTEIAMPSTENHGELRKDFPGGWENDSKNAFYDFGLNETESEAKNFMKTLLNWRKSSDAVGKGKLIHFPVTDGLYVYFRNYKEEIVMVAVNNLDQRKDLDLELYKDVIGGKKKAIEIFDEKVYSLRKKISIYPKSAKIFQIK